MIALMLASVQAAPPAAPEDARGSLAIYCRDSCEDLTIEGFQKKNRLPMRVSAPTMVVERWGLEFGLPDAEHLQALGSGDVDGVLRAEDVLVVSWAGPREGAAERIAQIGRAALSAGEWFEDLDSGMVYDADHFASVIDRYGQDAPDITAMTLLEGVQSEDGTRLVMHGLGKVGLPELVMTDIPIGEENAMAIALSTTAQSLYEQGLTSRLTIRADKLASESVRATACGIHGQALLTKKRPGADDTIAVLAEVSFTGGLGACGENTEPVSGSTQVEPASLEEAREAAMARLSGPIQDSFAVGLPEGAVLMVKAPFQGPRRSLEWLWLSVEQWRADGTMIGTLQSQPRRVMELDKGDEVVVDLERVFDYVLVLPDGTREGNTTGQFLQ
jgi:hypothetical protein